MAAKSTCSVPSSKPTGARGQHEIAAKTNAIPARKPLLEPLPLQGRVVTADALHTQRTRCLVEDEQAQYLFSVKENQPTLHADLKARETAHCPPCAPRCSIPRTGGLEHGVLRASTALNDDFDFPHVAQVCRIEREVIEGKSGKCRRETVFAITSLRPEQAEPMRLLTLNRGHWNIENRSHWVRDVTFNEGRARIRTDNGPAMMACLRNFAIALARLSGFTNIASALRAFASQPRRALAAIGV